MDGFRFWAFRQSGNFGQISENGAITLLLSDPKGKEAKNGKR